MVVTDGGSGVRLGDPSPNWALPRLDGGELELRSLRRRKVLLFFWGSWWRCREQLPGWQRFSERNQDATFQLVSIAVDAQGAEAARPWAEPFSGSFPTVVDSENRLAQIYGYKLIPNGVFLDEEGIIRYRKVGGFSIDNAGDVEAIQRLIGGDAEQIEAESRAAPYHLAATEREGVAARLRLGAELFRRGARGEAVAEWRGALRLDPENLTIRKQIWMAEHPEKFHPTIDFAWQQTQLAREREAEIAAGICGPDDCPLPGAAGR